MDDRDVILECKCQERGGTVVRSVKLAQLSFERVQFLWEKLSKFDVLFNDFVKDDFAAFVNHFIVQIDGKPAPAGLFWDVDDVGIILVNNIVPFQSATSHFVFWDKILKGREDLCREMLRYGFKTYKFRRIKVEVPLYAEGVRRFVQRIGFIQEGRLRKATLWRGDWFDVHVFSILPEDLDALPNHIPWGVYHNTCQKCGEVYNKEHKTKRAGATRGWSNKKGEDVNVGT